MMEQIFAALTFGLLLTGVIFVGLVRSREIAERTVRVRAARPPKKASR